jgi:hypothetical protein
MGVWHVLDISLAFANGLVVRGDFVRLIHPEFTRSRV